MAKAKKEVIGLIKLQIPAGQANPSPPVGPALGQKGLNIMDFCNQFNEKTKDQRGMPIPVVINAYSDRTFDFITKTPPASYLIMSQVANIKKGSKTPGREVIKEIKKSSLLGIAEIKQKDLDLPIESVVNQLAGTAKSMGIKVIED